MTRRRLSPILLSAVAVLLPRPAAGVVANPDVAVSRPVAAGGAHTCVINENQAVKCWGANDAGQTAAPTRTRGNPVWVTAGPRHTCMKVRTRDRDVFCWGDDAAGQSSPPASSGVFELAAGARHTCGIWPGRQGGTRVVRCWGEAEEYPPVGNGPLDRLVAGDGFTCARTGSVSGRPVCWGDNRYGQHDAPPVHAYQLGAGAHHVCATTTSEIVCWGDNAAGQAGTHPGEFAAVDGGDDFTCALGRHDGTLTCWGAPTAGQTSPPAGAFRPETLSVGGHHACAARVEDSVVMCWGDNTAGQAPAAAAQS